MKEDNFATCLGLIVSIVILVVVGTIADGWALSTIWNWFVPPLFKLTSLTFMQAVGVSMVLRLFTGSNKSVEQKKNANRSSSEILVEALVVSIATAVFSVAVAWVVLQFAF